MTIGASKPKDKSDAKRRPIAKTTAQALLEKPIVSKVEKAVPTKVVSGKKPSTEATSNRPQTAKTIGKSSPAVVIKPKKSRLIRDSFTIPDHEYKLIQTLKDRSISFGMALKKSELIRAGILKLIALSDAEFKKAILAVDIIKTGRPTKAK